MAHSVIMAEFSDVRYDARVLKEASALAKLGYKLMLHMYNTSIDKDVIKNEGNITYYIYAFPNRFKNSGRFTILKKYFEALRILLRINLWILSHKSDFYHAHNLKFLLSSYLSSMMYNAKLIYDAHEIHSEHYDNKYLTNRIKNKLNMHLERLILPKCTAFIQASEERAKYISKKYNILMPHVINNYVPFCKPDLGNKLLRNELNLKNYPIMFYSGGIYLGGGRRLDNVLKALKDIENIYFVIIGFMNESIKQQLDKLLIEYSLTSKVFILPPKPYDLLFNYASSADFGIIPLAGESINTKLSALNKISEYFMAGLPVLCSDYENLKRIVNDNPVGKVGITFNVHSISSIKEAINKMLIEHSITNMKLHALELARTKYNWENEIKVLKKIYKTK